MSMFCGLPISVAAEPTFDPAARPSRNGTGSSLRRAQPSTSSGAIARHTMSFTSTAESAPATRTTASSSRGGDTSSAAMRAVTRA